MYEEGCRNHPVETIPAYQSTLIGSPDNEIIEGTYSKFENECGQVAALIPLAVIMVQLSALVNDVRQLQE